MGRCRIVTYKRPKQWYHELLEDGTRRPAWLRLYMSAGFHAVEQSEDNLPPVLVSPLGRYNATLGFGSGALGMTEGNDGVFWSRAGWKVA